MFLIVGCMVFICASGRAVSQMAEAPNTPFSITAADTNPTVNPTDSSSSSWSGSNTTSDCWSLGQKATGGDLQNSTNTLPANLSEEYQRCQNSSLLTTQMPTVIPTDTAPSQSEPPPSTSASPNLSNSPVTAMKNQLSSVTQLVSTSRTSSYSDTVEYSTKRDPETSAAGGVATDRQVAMVTRKDRMDRTDAKSLSTSTHWLNTLSSTAGALKSTATPTYPGSRLTTSTAAPTSRIRPKKTAMKNIKTEFVDVDYDGDTSQEAERIRKGPSLRCNYDPCTHLQKPCTEIFYDCLCPGHSPASERPDTPPMSLGEVTHNSVQVMWCAPSSHVEEYRMEVQQQGGGLPLTLTVNSMSRRATMFTLLEGRAYNICLTAENRAGSSLPVCEAFSTKVNNLYLYALVSLAGLLVVATSVLSVLLYKQCKKQPMGSPHLTSLISIPNPAFCNPEERMGSSTNIFRI